MDVFLTSRTKLKNQRAEPIHNIENKLKELFITIGGNLRWFKQLTKNLLKSIHFRNLFSMISFK